MPEAVGAHLLHIRGRVQAVGFRPFIVRLAQRFGLKGWVRNAGGIVEIHIEGASEKLATFIDLATTQAPPLAAPSAAIVSSTKFHGYEDFEIRESSSGNAEHLVVPPDFFICDDCLEEMSDPKSRRFDYPFTNCTQCGPRYTIIDQLPYDRAATAMAEFSMCAACKAEYESSSDRRYHAQPIACPDCGPVLQFHAQDHEPIIGNEPALSECVRTLDSGRIVAVKGIGGYHLFCDAQSESAIQLLRHRKNRPTKPLAVMAPKDFSIGQNLYCKDTQIALRELQSPLRPIMLIKKDTLRSFPESIAPGLDEIGLMLPYSPLHHLLLSRFKRPLVATSGNLGGDAIVTDPERAENELSAIADGFLHHNRPILRPADDSVMRVIAGAPRPMRIGRGLAPLQIRLKRPLRRPLLAVGNDMKSTIAIAKGDCVTLSPHIGDLGGLRSLQTFEKVISDLSRLYAIAPEMIVSDAHPGYFSSRWACAQDLPVHRVFHHHAHASAVFHECASEEEMLVFTWDGLGFGEDETYWGGEALIGAPGRWRRVASIRPFRLIGGDKASRDPWRCGLATCLESGLTWLEKSADTELATLVWRSDINCPRTTSIGRLFDAAAALIGVARTQSYEGEAAMRLETIADRNACAVKMPLYNDNGVWRADWRPLLPTLRAKELSTNERSSIFHSSLSEMLVDQAKLLREKHEFVDVGLGGGVFQNRRLAEQAVSRLQSAGFRPFLPRLLPVNDASISVGQIIEAHASSSSNSGRMQSNSGSSIEPTGPGQ